MACGVNPTTSVELVALVGSAGTKQQQQTNRQTSDSSLAPVQSAEPSWNGHPGQGDAYGSSNFHFSIDSLPKKSTTFKLEPEYIPGPKTPGDGASDASKQNRDRTRAKIRKIVCVVGVSLTVICIVLVAISFALGQEIDRMGKCDYLN
ncbi:hypothetical protein D918_07320 [Trichuris suis]|nr:hypothetical protein D918_07320 [Trichuris suis]